MLVLGVHNILRYYYIQKLEDQLHKLNPDVSDADGQSSFLHWNAFLAPIITRNPHHIKSFYTAAVFICYSVAAIGVVVFCVAMALTLYMQITPKNIFDRIIAGIFIFIAALEIVLFFLGSIRAKEMSIFAWNIARENQAKRKTGKEQNQYETNTSPSRMLSYLIYPKRQDVQKPLLICLGFIYGFLFMNRTLKPMYLKNLIIGILEPTGWQKLLFAWFVFDFLAYQARYQINDIRGIAEDKEAGKTNRLPIDACKTSKDAIKISWGLAVIKIIASVTIAIVWGGEIRLNLMIDLGLLLISTILYEIARAMGKTGAIFFWVGAGYPLRFFVGFFLVVPLKSIMSSWLTAFIIALIAVALWAYGSLSAILPWTDEVIQRMKAAKEADRNNKGKRKKSFPPSYRKKHFGDLQKHIMKKYMIETSCCSTGKSSKVLPLREMGSLSDPWNLAMLICMLCLFIAASLEKRSIAGVIIEGIILITYILSIYLSKWSLTDFGWVCILGKTALNLLVGPFSMCCLLLSLLQMLVTITYFVLRYQPQFKKFDYKDWLVSIKDKLTKVVLGKYAFDILHTQNNGK